MVGSTYRYAIQFAYLWIIVTENSLSKAEYCPCTINIIVHSANCSGRDLYEIPGCVPSTTKSLDLSKNHVSYRPRQFQRFTSLTYLNLSSNKHFSLGNDSFENLTHLKELFLDNTSFMYKETSAIAELSHLVKLSLLNCRVESLPADFFVKLDKLTYLNLFKTSFRVFDIRNYQVSGQINLRYLNLASNLDLILYEHSFSGLINLEELNLSKCRLKNLSLDMFSQLHRLTYLNLARNSFCKIHHNAFLNFSNLSQLDLSFILDLSLSNNSFVGLLNLKFLSFKGTTIRHFSSLTLELFQPLVQLEELHLEGVCTLKEINACSKIDELLGSLPSLKTLYLDNFLLNFLGRGFRFMQALDELNFVYGDGCIIQSLSNETFDNLQKLSVSKIRIEMCEIEEIIPYAFSCFRKLSLLELNSVTSSSWCFKLYPFVFETGLQNTNIKHFRFQPQCDWDFSLFIGTLSGLAETQLEYLEISKSSVYDIHSDFFHSLPISVKCMSLQNNYIQGIRGLHDLYGLQNLQILNLSNQKQPRLSAQGKNISAKANAEDLRSQDSQTISDVSVYNQNLLSSSLKLAKNNENIYYYQKHQLRINQCWHAPHRKCLPALREIDISHSGLLCEVVKLLKNTTSPLEALNISYQKDSKCFEIVWGVIKRLFKLEKLTSDCNRINYIPFDAFSQLRNLKILSLQKNSLAVLSFELNTLVLEKLDVSDNGIIYLSNELTQRLSQIAQQSKLNIYLSGNSLFCDCERVAFVSWLRYTKSIYEKDKLTCHIRNTNYTVSKIAKLYEILQYECTAQEVVRSCITGFVFLNLVLGIVTLIWYRRWKIKYLLALGRKIVRPYHPIEECEVEFEYDVYISYDRDYNITNSEHLHDLVTQKLYPGLQRRGFRVFIREEIDPGMGLYNGISGSLRRSRKIIALITKNYCKDHWNVFEFNMAVLEGIYTKREVLIPVALESLGRENLHAEVYAYLSAEPVSYYSCNVTEATLLGFLTKKVRDNRNLD